MENKETFKLDYSAGQQEEIRSIRQKYLPPEESKLDRLRALDASVGKRASCIALTVGILGTLVMGVGMSLTISDLGLLLGRAAFPVGITLGLLGIALLVCAYPLYCKTLKRERERIAPEIIRLTDELMK